MDFFQFGKPFAENGFGFVPDDFDVGPVRRCPRGGGQALLLTVYGKLRAIPFVSEIFVEYVEERLDSKLQFGGGFGRGLNLFGEVGGLVRGRPVEERDEKPSERAAVWPADFVFKSEEVKFREAF